MRLFTALLPPPQVVASLRDELARHPRDEGSGVLRWTGPAQWHLTLGFYGRDDPVARAHWLRERLAGLPAPTVRLTGAGTFPGVLWTGVQAAGLAELAAAVRPESEDREFRAHLTLARGDAPGALAVWTRLLAGYRSPRWTAGEVVLMRSDPGPGGPAYTTVERFRLGAPAGENLS
ncbi:RNA 2',3'-cyclic phosphodiesterase [Prauserella muralis]|uniref:RNA 2',3'-cyclic phosphodiesterase n=1 Tax=Prauserella muralis TaxID=588067 RepID=A0A2V4B133_9PSEU|nr:RNA 2',3'-cyclic phosphodiesterase [Prauserella muralis]PXY27981.1 2'-5' RNA ligase [Prauserella muralis]TWE22231.1 2'-5' RNA ligase [Prauserella muralis]